jgi:hypothetical protein
MAMTTSKAECLKPAAKDSSLILPQPLQNLFELGPNLFYPYVNLAFARAFFVFTFLV